MKNLEEILKFYKKTSTYTDLGFYKDFAKNLPDDLEELCLLQRYQIIHPINLIDEKIRKNKNSFYGDMTKIPETRLIYEDDIFPTAQSILAELLRKNPTYEIEREIQNKVHVTCRGQAILLVAILKSKGIPARVRSGFAEYSANEGIYWDHWITEYFDKTLKKWILVDADCCCNDIDFDPYNLPREKFLLGGNAWLAIRRGEYKEEQIAYDSAPVTLGLKAAIRGLFYDFHCLMNDEIIFLHMPKYIRDKNFELSEEEYKELDNLAELMLNPNENFGKLQEIWENNVKFRIMSGALN